MTKYRETLRLHSLKLSQRNIALSCSVSKTTVNRVLKRAAELNLSWPLNDQQTESVLSELLFSASRKNNSEKRLPNFDYIRNELLKNGVSKKLLWAEYMEECRLNNEESLTYSQFCRYIQLDGQKRRATMHISRKPGEQVEVDWAGDPAKIIDPDTGVATETFLFVGVMTYSQYAYVEAFINEKEPYPYKHNDNRTEKEKREDKKDFQKIISDRSEVLGEIVQSLNNSEDTLNNVAKSILPFDALFNKSCSKEDLCMGDHLYVQRVGYTHHGIYVGDNNVMHYLLESVTLSSLEEFTQGAALKRMTED